MRADLTDEGRGKFDMGRPAELADRLDPSERITAVDQGSRIPGEGRRIAADIGNARHGRLPIVSQRETAEGVEITLAARLDLLRVAAVALAPVAALVLVLLWTGRG